MNVLQDTAALVFAKQYGFRFGDVPSRFLAPTIEVLSCDFARDAPGDWKAEMEHLVTCSEAGTAHCVVLFWEASQGGPGRGTMGRLCGRTDDVHGPTSNTRQLCS